MLGLSRVTRNALPDLGGLCLGGILAVLAVLPVRAGEGDGAWLRAGRSADGPWREARLTGSAPGARWFARARFGRPGEADLRAATEVRSGAWGLLLGGLRDPVPAARHGLRTGSGPRRVPDPGLHPSGRERGFAIRLGDRRSFLAAGALSGPTARSDCFVAFRLGGVEAAVREEGEGGRGRGFVSAAARPGGHDVRLEAGRDPGGSVLRGTWASPRDAVRLQGGAGGRRPEERGRVLAGVRVPTSTRGEARIEGGWSGLARHLPETTARSRFSARWSGLFFDDGALFRFEGERTREASGAVGGTIEARAESRLGPGETIGVEWSEGSRRSVRIEVRRSRRSRQAGMGIEVTDGRGRALDAWGAFPAPGGGRSRLRVRWRQGDAARFEAEWGMSLAGLRFPRSASPLHGVTRVLSCETVDCDPGPCPDQKGKQRCSGSPSA